MAVKELQTRIQLKYDSYENWKDSELVLLPGEVGICTIGTTDETGKAEATNNPTVLFKVGDGNTPFKTLKWASALAADVYGWAKADAVVFDSTDKKIKFKKGTEVVHDIDLSDFAAASTVADHTDRIADLEAALGLDDGASEGSVSKQIADIVERLGVIQGADTAEGSIAKALNDAKAYTDEREVAIKAAYEAYADQAEADAKAYTDGEVEKLESKDAELLGKIGENTTAIGNEVTARQEADNAITAKIGEGFDATNTVAVKVKAAQDAADAAQADVDALIAENGVVTKNTADIAQLKDDLAEEVKDREDGDKALDERLVKVETFFAGAYDEDGKALNAALDTLVEIQDYLDGDGTAAGTLVDKVAQNASDIADIQETLAEGGDFEKRVAEVEASASANADAIESLKELTAGDFGEGKTIKAAIDEAVTKGQQGIDDAKDAADAAKTAQDEVDALELIVGNEETGLAATKAIADKAAADVAALSPKVEQAEKDIDALEAIVKTGENTNAQLRADIEALEAIVVTGADANATLGGEIDAIAAKVNDEETGLTVTNTTATDAVRRVAAIEADYLKAADTYIFNCGGASGWITEE